jgi:putative transposase
MHNIIDEFTKKALVIRVKCKLNSTNVVDALTDLFTLCGPPRFIRSDNGTEFVAKKVRNRIPAVGAKATFIEPGPPWENGYCESFKAHFRDELLNGELFFTLREAQIPTKNGAATTRLSGRTTRWDTDPQRRKQSCQWN